MDEFCGLFKERDAVSRDFAVCAQGCSATAPSAHCPTVSSMPATHPLSASPSASRMMSLVSAVDHECEFRIGLDADGSLGARSGSGAAGVVSCLRRGLLSGGLPVAA